MSMKSIDEQIKELKNKEANAVVKEDWGKAAEYRDKVKELERQKVRFGDFTKGQFTEPVKISNAEAMSGEDFMTVAAIMLPDLNLKRMNELTRMIQKQFLVMEMKAARAGAERMLKRRITQSEADTYSTMELGLREAEDGTSWPMRTYLWDGKPVFTSYAYEGGFKFYTYPPEL